MASKAGTGRGTAVSIGGVTGAGGSETWTKIEEVTEAGFSGTAMGTVDVTNFDSGVDDEFVSSTRDNGNCVIKGNLIDVAPGQLALSAAADAGEKYDFKVQLRARPGYTTGRTFTFSGLVLGFKDIPIGTKTANTFSSTVKISGPITDTPAVPAS